MARNIKPIDPSQWESMQQLRSTNPVDSILRVMEFFSNQNRNQKQSKKGAYATAYNEFYKDIHGHSDLELINTEIDRMKSYYSQNRDAMDPEMIENFNLLSQQAQYHKEDMAAYRTGLHEMNKKGEDYLKLVEEYNDAPDFTRYPLVLEEGMRTKDMVSEDLNASVVDYIGWSDKFFAKYGDKLQTPKFSHDKNRIESFDDIMRAGVGMISNRHFSNEQKAMLIGGITEKSMNRLNDYIDFKHNFKVLDAQDARVRGRASIDIINENARLLDAQKRITEEYLDIETGEADSNMIVQWNRIKDKPVYEIKIPNPDYPDEELDLVITNENLLKNFTVTSEGHNFELNPIIKDARYNMEDAIKEFENADRVFMNTTGESILNNYPIMYSVLNKK